MGIESALDPYMSLALGSSEVNLLELTAAYGTFANGGLAVPPVFITRIVGPDKEVVEENLPQCQSGDIAGIGLCHDVAHARCDSGGNRATRKGTGPSCGR